MTDCVDMNGDSTLPWSCDMFKDQLTSLLVDVKTSVTGTGCSMRPVHRATESLCQKRLQHKSTCRPGAEKRAKGRMNGNKYNHVNK